MPLPAPQSEVTQILLALFESLPNIVNILTAIGLLAAAYFAFRAKMDTAASLRQTEAIQAAVKSVAVNAETAAKSVEEVKVVVHAVAVNAETAAKKVEVVEATVITIAAETSKTAESVSGNLSEVQKKLAEQTARADALQQSITTLTGILGAQRPVNGPQTIRIQAAPGMSVETVQPPAPIPVAIVPASEPLPVDVTEKKKP